MEDECHKLDLQMATSSSPVPGDRQSYTNYAQVVQSERALLDEKEQIKAQLAWLDQTLSFLTLNSLNPANDPSVEVVKSAVSENKSKLAKIVRIRKT